ncbi:Transient receptor potential channel [Toxocara canis]|uniref:Transient receptor potential channel n=1 Tax=Toxocara canis TaxID=6265 RepID=A0A0B2VDM2_TOXCA|nr:Transient receptor potential channel [Toxocara canis]
MRFFSNIFNETNAISQQVWLFQRYEQVLEYENTPLIPPPFTPVAHLITLIKYLSRFRIWNRRKCRRVQDKHGTNNFAMKAHLDEDEMRKLHDFEEDCMDDLSRKKFISEALKSETRLQTTAERTEIMYSRLSEMMNDEWNLKSTVWDIESRLDSIEKNQRDIMEMLHTQSMTRANVQGSVEQRRCIRRNEGYTSITDAIKLLMPLRTDAEASLETPSAKPSFTLRQNEMLRDYEEASSQITSEIIAGRRRRGSSTWSACEDMHEMDKATGRVGSDSSSTESSGSPIHSVQHKLEEC